MTRSQFGALDELSHDMERVFDSLLGRTVGTMMRTGGGEKYSPALDVSETESEFCVKIDLPGIKPEEVKVEVLDNNLVVSGNRNTESEESTGSFHRVERRSGSFTRSISIPSEVDVESIDAHYEHGVLAVTLPKLAKQQPKKVQIRTAE